MMFTAHVKAVRDLRNNYPDLAKIIRNQDHVIITNNGKSEAVLIPYDEFEKYTEFLHIRYVQEKLIEAEAIADDPNKWISVNELFRQWDNWSVAKV